MLRLSWGLAALLAVPVLLLASAGPGFAQAVAPLGTALTEEQMSELWRLVPEPTLCFDGDGAGEDVDDLRLVDMVVAAGFAARRDAPLDQLKSGAELAPDEAAVDRAGMRRRRILRQL